MGKEINAILGAQTILIWTYGFQVYLGLHFGLDTRKTVFRVNVTRLNYN